MTCEPTLNPLTAFRRRRLIFRAVRRGLAATMWRTHGAEVRLWSVQVGEVGNLAFTAGFESNAQLGATLDKLNSDPEFGAWRMKNLKAGLATWVRSNQAYEIKI